MLVDREATSSILGTLDTDSDIFSFSADLGQISAPFKPKIYHIFTQPMHHHSFEGVFPFNVILGLCNVYVA